MQRYFTSASLMEACVQTRMANNEKTEHNKCQQRWGGAVRILHTVGGVSVLSMSAETMELPVNVGRHLHMKNLKCPSTDERRLWHSHITRNVILGEGTGGGILSYIQKTWMDSRNITLNTRVHKPQPERQMSCLSPREKRAARGTGTFWGGKRSGSKLTQCLPEAIELSNCFTPHSLKSVVLFL